MTLAIAMAGVMLAGLLAYAATAGADFGGGVWDLLARGPRAAAQREVIERALAPVWEANHVWLIFIVVVMFTAFAPAFARIGEELHVPLTIMLVGIVMRGSAFVFRQYGGSKPGERRARRSAEGGAQYDAPGERRARSSAEGGAQYDAPGERRARSSAEGGAQYDAPGERRARSSAEGGAQYDDQAERKWGVVFAVSSLIAPLCLGATLGAMTTEQAWWQLVPLAFGVLAVVAFAFLAASYLAVEATGELRDDFRRRTQLSGYVVAAIAAVTALLCGRDAPEFFAALAHSTWSIPVIGGATCALVAATQLSRRGRVRAARACAIATVELIVLGWGGAQYPQLVAPDLTIENAAAPDATLRALLPIIVAGTVILLPSLWWLLRVFKKREG